MNGPSSFRPLHTYSILAHDEEAGQLGGAVHSHWFSVGSVVLWGKGGVGLVAVQSIVQASQGPRALAMLEEGRSPNETLHKLLATDPLSEIRQVAILDRAGRIATHTGERCIPMAGHRQGPGYSAQANLMEREGVWEAMAEAFESSTGDLAERLMLTLEAAEEAGGDIRGQQSAAILVVGAGSAGSEHERIVDLRVEDHQTPVAEMRRLLSLHYAYQHMSAGDEALGRGDVDGALAYYRAAGELVPNPEMSFWHAVGLANAGRLDEALSIFHRVFQVEEKWADLLPRLADVQLLRIDEEALGRILAVRT